MSDVAELVREHCRDFVRRIGALDELIGQRLELDDVDKAFTAMSTGEVARSVVALAG